MTTRFLWIGLRAFGEAWNKKPGALVRLTTLRRALFRCRKESRVMFLSTEGHRLVSRILGQALVRDIALNFEVRWKSMEWNKTGTALVL
jgi:hypothetical protein